MAFLTPYTRAQIVQLIATEYANVAAVPADTSVGAAIGSVFNAKALAAMALQQQIIYLANIARLATVGPNLATPGSPNPDVDSFVNPFGVFREQASASTGQVTFATNYPPTQSILIPAVPLGSTGGVIVQTPSGVQFQVIADTTNANYNATANGYYLAAGTTTIAATVQCTSLGTLGNVAANQITILYSGPGTTNIAGIATCTNAAAFTNAAALETDTALINRFATQMSTGTTGTVNAIGAAVLGTQLGLTYSVGDSLNSSGGSAPGTITVVVNNAGGATSPSSSLLSAVQVAVNGARSAGITATVIAPTLVPVNISANIKIAPGYGNIAVIAACTAAYTTLVNSIGLDPGGATTAAKIAAVYFTLYGTPGVSDVTSLQLNGGTVDVTAQFASQLVVGSVTLSPY